MCRNLLLDRFKMTVHFEKRDFLAYELTVAKGGLKMKEFVPDPKIVDDPSPNGIPRPGPLNFKDGFPVLEPGNRTRAGGIDVNGRMLYSARAVPIQEIADRILQSALKIENGPGSCGNSSAWT